ncbi:hypothetical protein D9613_012221 [Agrocybe pediades]|uniref:Uncharacterized protein n=1 Tax=Agrocybe pediades TaxID=84607 RepID=A0A8H4QF31_9AGAR|nr:hypothetical protein D9613_012221 [Agrocybe pediades]KAF9543331.1 hypothetical protein CPC08DRAFT_824171 [Agrocybe pediades]
MRFASYVVAVSALFAVGAMASANGAAAKRAPSSTVPRSPSVLEVAVAATTTKCTCPCCLTNAGTLNCC